MLKNFWYALEQSSAVGPAPRRVKVFGQELVLYRAPDDSVVALSALCVHRGGDLGGGQVVDGCLRCPYHGWRYDASGRCVSIPANPPGAPIPQRARVDSYPVVERYGWVWVFLGDLPPEARPPIPPLPESGQPGWKAIFGEYQLQAHYARVMENGLDYAHGPFVHANSFGNIDEPEVADYQVVADEYGGSAEVALPAQKPRGIWGLFGRKHRPAVPVRLSFSMPNLIRIHLRPTPSWQVVIFAANIPVDENHTRTLWISLRNFLRRDWADRDARRRTLDIFREDQPVVEAQRPIRPPLELTGELLVRSDQLPITYRRLRKQFFDRGWGIDSDELQRLAGTAPRAIPSPARRQPELDRAWVIPELPTHPAPPPK